MNEDHSFESEETGCNQESGSPIGETFTYEAALEQLDDIISNLKSDQIQDVRDWRDIGQGLLLGNPYILGVLAKRLVPELRDVPEEKIANEYLINVDIGGINVRPDSASSVGFAESDATIGLQAAPRGTRVFIPGAAPVEDRSLTDGIVAFDILANIRVLRTFW